MPEFGFDRDKESRLGRAIRHRRTRQSSIAFLQGMGSVLDIFPAVNESMPKLGLYRKIAIVHAKQLRRANEVLRFERAKVRRLRTAK